jgi:pyrimidine-nucleoside phosphorylase
MTLRDLIEQKRDGGHIPATDWRAFTQAVADGSAPDYQIAALLMAIYFRGLAEDETVALMDGMLGSGRTLDLRSLGRPRIDKHSTGGVGDKVSLILAPVVAACGVAVPMMSGRGLGHTGGTLDKLDAIPGFDSRLSLEAAARQIAQLNCALIGQTDEIAPADKRLYAMRDATGTVEAIPLIAASIMSKKLAESLTGLVLDVKTGRGAFLPRFEDSIALIQLMIRLGERHGCPVVGLLTDMDSPLGEACGNANEVVEAVELLHGRGPADLREVTLALGAEMLLLADAADGIDVARAKLNQAIASGAALDAFRAIVKAQGGDPRVCDDPRAIVAQPTLTEAFAADRDGIVQQVEPRAVGKGITAMGGGRNTMDDVLDHSVGFRILAKPGATVRRGETLAIIEARDAASAAIGRDALARAYAIGDAPVAPRPLISHRVTSGGVQTLT